MSEMVPLNSDSESDGDDSNAESSSIVSVQSTSTPPPTKQEIRNIYNTLMEMDQLQDDDGNLRDFSGFDGGSCLQRLHDTWTESAHSGAMFERKNSCAGALDAFRSTVFSGDDTTMIMDIINKLVNDEEQSVRKEIMHQLPQIALFCHEEGPRLDFVVPQHVLPHIVQSLSDKYTQVRKTSQACLLLLLEKGIVAPSQVEEHICPVILRLLNDQKAQTDGDQFTEPRAHDDHRAEIVGFMSKLAPLVGKEITVNTYLDKYCRLCDDPLFQVRRVCATSMGDIATVIGTKLTELVLLPKFMALSGDEVWGVRKGAAEVFTIVASVCRLSTRKKTLAPRFVRLLTDPSRWVRVASYSTLGPLITTFATDDGHTVSPDSDTSEAERNFLYRRGCDIVLTIEEDLNPAEGESSIVANSQQQQQQSQTASSPLVLTNMKSSLNSSQSSVIFTTTATAATATGRKSNDCNNTRNNKSWSSDDEEDEGTFMAATRMNVDQNDEYASGSNPIRPAADGSCCSMEIDENDDGDNNGGNNENQDDSSGHYCEAGRERKFGGLKQKESDSGASMDPCERGDADSSFILYEMSTTSPTKQDGNKMESDDDSGSSWSISNFSSSNKSSSPLVDQPEVSCPGVVMKNQMLQQQQQQQDDNTDDGSNANIASGQSTYNTFQYWKVPLPEIRVEFDDTTSSNATASKSDQQQTLLLLNANDKKSEDALNGNLELDNDASGSYGGAAKSATSEIIQRVSDVHRSYLNLYNASRDQHEMDEMGLDSLRLVDPYDSDDQFSSPFPYGEDCSSLWGAKTQRSRLLQDIPKSTTPAQQQDIVPDPLLEHFNSMANLGKELPVDSELTGYCVYNLPAVVLTMGPQNWSLLRECYEALACSMQWKVRYTLAASLHEIARVLGPELSERDLVPFYNALTKDLDEVRVGVLRNLSSFVEILGKDERRKCLGTLRSFLDTENKRNWRFRLELTNQLEQLSEMFEPDEVLQHICPISVDLILDTVAEVRRKSLQVVTHLVRQLNRSSQQAGVPNLVREFLLELVTTLGKSERWVRRQNFASLSGHFVELGALSPNQFAQDILPHLIDLTSDKVPNVRLTVAQTLTKYVIKNEYFADHNNPHSDILACTMEKLQNDQDRDVRFFSSDRISVELVEEGENE